MQKQNCPICGSNSKEVTKAFDHLYHNQGTWSIDKCENPECGHFFQNPIPSNEELGNYYPQDYYAFAAPLQNEWPVNFKNHPRLFLSLCYLKYFRSYKHLKIPANFLTAMAGKLLFKKPLKIQAPYYKANKRFLDFGSGSGNDVSYMKFVGWDACGIEISKGACEAGQKAGLNIMHGTSELLDDKPDSFAYVYTSHCLEHVPDVVNVIQKIYGSMENDGILAIDLPNGSALAFSVYKQDFFYLCPPVHVNIFTVKSMKKMLREAGFKNIEVSSYSNWRNQARSMALKLFNPGTNYHFTNYHGLKLFIGHILSYPVYLISSIGLRGDCLVVKCTK